MQVEQGELGYKPLVIVIDTIYRHDIEMKSSTFSFYKLDIGHREVISKENALARYGAIGKDGALVLSLGPK